MKPFLVGTDHIEVVHITAIMSAFQLALHELVKDIEIDIAEQLRSQVADGQAAAFRRVEQTFVERQPFPIRLLPLHPATYSWIKQDNGLGKILDEIHIHHILPLFRPMTRHPMAGHLVDGGKADSKQTLPIDMHEIATDVHLHHITGYGIILAFLPDMLLKPFYAIVRATSLDATVAVVDESALIHQVCVVVIEVMNDTVSKVGGKYLAFFGVGDDETGRGQRLVGAIP